MTPGIWTPGCCCEETTESLIATRLRLLCDDQACNYTACFSRYNDRAVYIGKDAYDGALGNRLKMIKSVALATYKYCGAGSYPKYWFEAVEAFDLHYRLIKASTSQNTGAVAIYLNAIQQDYVWTAGYTGGDKYGNFSVVAGDMIAGWGSVGPDGNPTWELYTHEWMSCAWGWHGMWGAQEY